VFLVSDFNLAEYRARNTRQNIDQEINVAVDEEDRADYL
jgi:hypothetical protein